MTEIEEKQMKKLFHAGFRLGGFTFFMSLFSAVFGVAPATLAQTYSITDLGTLGGGSSFAGAINNSGQIVGSSPTAGSTVPHAFLYSGGVMTDLGTLGGSQSTAYDINNNGQVVGAAFTASGDQHAFLYSGGVMRDLGTLGGSVSQAGGINDSGQIAGSSYTATGPALGYAFLYSGGVMTHPG